MLLVLLLCLTVTTYHASPRSTSDGGSTVASQPDPLEYSVFVPTQHDALIELCNLYDRAALCLLQCPDFKGKHNVLLSLNGIKHICVDRYKEFAYWIGCFEQVALRTNVDCNRPCGNKTRLRLKAQPDFVALVARNNSAIMVGTSSASIMRNWGYNRDPKEMNMITGAWCRTAECFLICQSSYIRQICQQEQPVLLLLEYVQVTSSTLIDLLAQAYPGTSTPTPCQLYVPKSRQITAQPPDLMLQTSTSMIPSASSEPNTSHTASHLPDMVAITLTTHKPTTMPRPELQLEPETEPQPLTELSDDEPDYTLAQQLPVDDSSVSVHVHQSPTLNVMAVGQHNHVWSQRVVYSVY